MIRKTNDKMELLDINFIKNTIKDKASYFIFLTVLILTIPVLLYINDKPKFTVSMIVEAESSMKLSRLQRDWTNLHYIANLELPHVGEKDSKKNSLGDILLSDFLAVLTSPSKFYSVYEQYYNAGKITETFEDTYKKFNVVFVAPSSGIVEIQFIGGLFRDSSSSGLNYHYLSLSDAATYNTIQSYYEQSLGHMDETGFRIANNTWVANKPPFEAA